MSMGHDSQIPVGGVVGEPRCEFERSLRGEYCAKTGEVRLVGLLLCPKHDARVRLEEQAACWEALVHHAGLWPEVARRQGRDDLARALEAERAKIIAVLGRVRRDLERIPS